MDKKEQRALLFGKIKPQGNQSNDNIHKLLEQLVEQGGDELILDLSEGGSTVFESKEAARAAVPADDQTAGAVITYQYYTDEEQTETETVIEQFVGDAWTTEDALWKEYTPQPDVPTAIHIVAESNTTINGYEVPELTTEQITQAFNALAGGDLVVVTDADEQMHFLVTQADIVDGDKHISFEFYDKMQLQYAEDETITFTSRVIPDIPQPTVIDISTLEHGQTYTAEQLAAIGLTQEVMQKIIDKPSAFTIGETYSRYVIQYVAYNTEGAVFAIAAGLNAIGTDIDMADMIYIAGDAVNGYEYTRAES